MLFSGHGKYDVEQKENLFVQTSNLNLQSDEI